MVSRYHTAGNQNERCLGEVLFAHFQFLLTTSHTCSSNPGGLQRRVYVHADMTTSTFIHLGTSGLRAAMTCTGLQRLSGYS
jgi:hypothetical protein